jgi:hypothetical protein
LYHIGAHHKVKVRTGIFVALAHFLIFTVGDDPQFLVAVNSRPFCNLKVVQVPVFCGPAISMVDFYVTTGDFIDSAGGGGPYPEVGSIHPNVNTRIGGKVHCAAHFIVMRAGGKPLGTVVETVHGDPRFPLGPGQLKYIRWRSRCDQSAGVSRNRREKQHQQSNHLRQIFYFHDYIFSS